MADNITVTAGTGTTVATDNIEGVNYQRVKITWGADGTATDASAAAPVPVAFVNPKSYGFAVAAGEVTNVAAVHKFAHSRAGIQTTATDIWERADANVTQQVWLAPTAARIHAIVSSAAADDGDPAGNGARTVKIYGLKTWATAESNETVTLNGVTPVNTANAYVMINYMEVVTYGTSGPNVGTITATAATDGTISAVILPTEGITEMAIYGIPTGQSFYMTRLGCSISKASSTATDGIFIIRHNRNPDVQTTWFYEVNELSLQSTGTSSLQKTYEIPLRFDGPSLIKITGLTSASDVEAVVSFDGYLVTN